jgi:hypothetical protein
MDTVAMLLADGEAIDQALAAAEQARCAGGEAGAAAVAAKAYEQLTQPGLAPALHAYGRKLTTRCDWGVMTTLNVKQAPAYWQVIEKLEALLPAVPPRELAARGRAEEIWLSWEPAERAAALNLYRRRAGGRGRWTRVNKRPLRARCTMFVDRPAAGAYEYALAAVDESGWASPRSHAVSAACGQAIAPPRIVAPIPFTHVAAGRPWELRAVVLSDHDIADVSIVYRAGGAGRWKQAAMRRRFRDGYVGEIPGRDIRPGVLQWYVRARDETGGTSLWPASAGVDLPWSATVT